MSTVLIVFFSSLAAYLAADLLASKWSGEQRVSLPVGCVVVGLVCAVAAHYIAAWVAVLVWVLLVAMRFREAHLDRRSQRGAQDN